MKRILLFAILAMGLLSPTLAQSQPTPQRVDRLEHRVSMIEGKLRTAGDSGAILFLFGTFCALWAQNTGRSGWLWFFLGLFFSVITVLVLLAKNSSDIDKRRRTAPQRP